MHKPTRVDLAKSALDAALRTRRGPPEDISHWLVKAIEDLIDAKNDERDRRDLEAMG